MPDLWYYGKNEQQHGPVPLEDLKSLAASGTLESTDRSGRRGWRTGCRHQRLMAYSLNLPRQSPQPRLRRRKRHRLILGQKHRRRGRSLAVRAGRANGTDRCRSRSCGILPPRGISSRTTSCGSGAWRNGLPPGRSTVCFLPDRSLPRNPPCSPLINGTMATASSGMGRSP